MIKPFGLADHRPMARHVLLFFLLSSIMAGFCAIRMRLPDSKVVEATGVFASFWGSGWALSHGVDPYSQTPFTPVMGLPGHPLPEINLNPPLLLPLFQLLSKLDIGTALQALTVVSGALFMGCTACLVRRRDDLSLFKVGWLFVIPYFYNSIFLGQIYALFYALSALAWISLVDRRSTRAGLAIGTLIALRPIFSLWLVLLWLAGHRRLAYTAAAAAAGLTLASVLAYGPTTFARWLTALGTDKHAILGVNASLNGYLTRLGHPSLGLAAGAAIGIGACLWAWRTRSDAVEVSLLALTASMLASPLSWVDYATLLIPALLARRWGSMLAAAALLLCVPMQLPLMESLDPRWTGALCCAAYPLALLLIAADCVLQSFGWRGVAAEAASPARHAHAAAFGTWAGNLLGCGGAARAFLAPKRLPS